MRTRVGMGRERERKSGCPSFALLPNSVYSGPICSMTHYSTVHTHTHEPAALKLQSDQLPHVSALNHWQESELLLSGFFRSLRAVI